MTSELEHVDVARQRVEQLFRFLAELHDIRKPPPSVLDQHEWVYDLGDLPDHESVRLSGSETTEGADAVEFELVVDREDVLPCPPPPDDLEALLEPSWSERTGRVQLRQLDDSYRPIVLDPSQQARLRAWEVQRERWLEETREAEGARALFRRLTGLRRHLQREAELYDLVLSDGLLRTTLQGGDVVRHPILFQTLELEFDPDRPQFRLVESDQPPKLYSALLRHLDGADGQDLHDIESQLELTVASLWDRPAVTALLRRLIQTLYPTRGVFLDDAGQSGRSPSVATRPHLLLVRKMVGYGEVVRQFLEGLDARESIPSALSRIVGRTDGPLGPSEPSGGRPPKQPPEILLTKSSNQERSRTQLLRIRRCR